MPSLPGKEGICACRVRRYRRHEWSWRARGGVGSVRDRA